MSSLTTTTEAKAGGEHLRGQVSSSCDFMQKWEDVARSLEGALSCREDYAKMQQYINAFEAEYSHVTMRDTIKDWEAVYHWLKVAYTANKALPDSCISRTILHRYRSLISSFCVFSSYVIVQGTDAISAYTQRGACNQSVRAPADWSRMQARATSISDRLIKLAKQEIQPFMDSLFITLSDAVKSTVRQVQEQQDLQQHIKELQIEQTGLQEKTRALLQDAEEARIRELKAQKRDQVRTIVSVCIGLPFNTLGEAFSIRAERRELQAQLVCISNTLSLTEQRVEDYRRKKDNAGVMITALEGLVHVLGRIKTALEHVRVYWMGVAVRCKEHSDTEFIEAVQREGLQQDTLAALEEERLHWFVLGRTHRTLYDSLKKMEEAPLS